MVKIIDLNLKPLLENPFVTLNQIDSVIHRLQPGRKTISFTYNDQTYFAKIHTGVGWKEIIKNLLQLRWPIISAETEWNALLKLQKLGVKAPIPVAFGKKGMNPARLQSFIVTEALSDMINLEEFFKTQPRVNFSFKQYLIQSVANVARTLHENGMNHRDFYICHFLLPQDQLNKVGTPIYLIDLHRAQIRRKTPFRWRLKDISGLYFSTMDFKFTHRDYLRFMRYYRQSSLRNILKEERYFWGKVVMKAEKLYKKHSKDHITISPRSS